MLSLVVMVPSAASGAVLPSASPRTTNLMELPPESVAPRRRKASSMVHLMNPDWSSEPVSLNPCVVLGVPGSLDDHPVAGVRVKGGVLRGGEVDDAVGGDVPAVGPWCGQGVGQRIAPVDKEGEGSGLFRLLRPRRIPTEWKAYPAA